MNIHEATRSYENWMRSCTAVVAHLRLKHKHMRENPFFSRDVLPVGSTLAESSIQVAPSILFRQHGDADRQSDEDRILAHSYLAAPVGSSAQYPWRL